MGDGLFSLFQLSGFCGCCVDGPPEAASQCDDDAGNNQAGVH
jgi:hypothetical protein